MLTPQRLLHDFGGRSAHSRQAVRAMFDALGDADRPAVERWMPHFGRWAGRAIDRLPRHLARLAGRYRIAADADNSVRLLFALQTYYALLVRRLAERFGHQSVDASLPGNPFCWCDSARSPAAVDAVHDLTETCGRYQSIASPLADDCECDLFKPLYQDIFPRALRHQLGEYYTPDWLADHVLDQVGYTGDRSRRLLDPACGSGTFLLLALRRLLQGERGEGRGEREGFGIGDWGLEVESLTTGHWPLATPPLAPRPSALPVGFDLNPLAVMTARANYLIALADLLPGSEPVEVPIYLYDSILGRGEAAAIGNDAFDFVVGNPPWIAWDNLPDEDRQATKPLWERYGLFSLSGNDARHGGGKKDLSMLMLYAAADRYLKNGGRLGMVITQTLFQTKGAGDGFRRFRLGEDGPPLRVIRVDDMVALRPFGDAANWTSTIVLEKGKPTEYPVPYVRWEGAGGEGRGAREGNDECPADGVRNNRKHSVHHSHFACPIDPTKPTSPWFISLSNIPRRSPLAPRSSCYTAHLGANSGGANGVYWVEILGEADGGVLIRNLAGRGKHQIETVKQVIEPDLLYPLLRWGDVRRYAAVPSAYLLLAQDPATRSGIPESVMRAKYPRTLAYFERFRDLLTSRAAYRRYQQAGPFYSMYNVGPYTVTPIKVVWRRMDKQITAVVVDRSAGVPPATENAGGTPALQATPAPQLRPPIPQETCVLVACDTADEAHYLCALLNSAPINELIAAHSVRGGKGFGTPGMFDYLPIRRYCADDPRHVELAQLSGQSHLAQSPALQKQMDQLAEEVGSARSE
jgi:hypothetical protein